MPDVFINSDDFLIEIANSRNSSLELVNMDENNLNITKQKAESFLFHGILSEQKRFIQNQNIKIKQNPLDSEENLSTPNSSEESK